MMARGLLPGVKLEREYVRIYPNNGLAGPAVGAQTGGIDAGTAKVTAGQPVTWVCRDAAQADNRYVPANCRQ